MNERMLEAQRLSHVWADNLHDSSLKAMEAFKAEMAGWGESSKHMFESVDSMTDAMTAQIKLNQTVLAGVNAIKAAELELKNALDALNAARGGKTSTEEQIRSEE